jgi:hypothetical protein
MRWTFKKYNKKFTLIFYYRGYFFCNFILPVNFLTAVAGAAGATEGMTEAGAGGAGTGTTEAAAVTGAATEASGAAVTGAVGAGATEGIASGEVAGTSRDFGNLIVFIRLFASVSEKFSIKAKSP